MSGEIPCGAADASAPRRALAVKIGAGAVSLAAALVVTWEGYRARLHRFCGSPSFQYKVGETFKHDGAVKACKSGFHACEYPRQQGQRAQSAMLYLFERDSARSLLQRAHSAKHDVMNCRIVLDYRAPIMTSIQVIPFAMP